MGGVPSIPTDPTRKLQVIGAGYSRTGTVSMALALEKLLNGPVMHGGTHVLYREDMFMRKLAEAYDAKRAGDKQKLHKLLEEIFAGFVACTDMPTIDFIPDLLEVYPDAKVVLVTRDPEKWVKSIKPVAQNAGLWWLPYAMWPIPGWRWFPTLMREFQLSVRDFYQHDGKKKGPGPQMIMNWNQKVKNMVPAEKLLVMELKEGWGPLCTFLEVPVPDEPLPRANDTAAADKAAKEIVAKLLGIWSSILTTFGAVALGTWWLWKAK